MSTDVTEIEFTNDEILDLSEKIFNFTELLCARAFYPYQVPMAKAIIVDVVGDLGNVVTGIYSRQSGKSETVANVSAAMMVVLPKLANMKDGQKYIFPALKNYRRGFLVGIFSPSTTQSSTTYKRLRDRLTSTDGRFFLNAPDFALEGFDTLLPFIADRRDYIELNNGSSCLMMTADKQANIESKTFHLILLDESQDLNDTVVNKSIMPMAAHYHGSAVATGTPGITKGFFYKQIKENEREELMPGRGDYRLQPKLNFAVNYKIVQKYVPSYKKFVQKERKRLGEHSDEFQQAYNLKWLLERGMAVPEELFEQLSLKSKQPIQSEKGIDLVAGLDFGKNQDSTVLTIGRPDWQNIDDQGRCPVEVIHWWDKLGDNYEEIFAELKDRLSRFSVTTLACDATGAGEPLVDRLIVELPFITVIPVKFSSQSKDHLYKNFLLMLQEKLCHWPAHPETKKRKYWLAFRDEMTSLVKEHKGQYLTCHAPEDQKHAHDDFPDSLALMLWCINEAAMPLIDQGTADFYHGRNWNNTQSVRTEFSLRR